jgi:NAD(P)-dependent dehydrogenase (short-subunit alcohol dehydrogenase family)
MSASSAFLSSLYSLSGKVAVVIGGTGEAAARWPKAWPVPARRSCWWGAMRKKPSRAWNSIHAAGGKGYFVSAEASEKAALQQLLDTVLQRSGKVDIVVNGAG